MPERGSGVEQLVGICLPPLNDPTSKWETWLLLGRAFCWWALAARQAACRVRTGTNPQRPSTPAQVSTH